MKSLFDSCEPDLALVSAVKLAFQKIESLPLGEQIETINHIKIALHEVSPFKSEPVDCVVWKESDEVNANDYNPNSVAPPEMRLLEHSIGEDGYTQPVVTWLNAEKREVVDGFHRTRVAKESKSVRARVHGYVPVVTINDHREDRGDRMAATIRHNRARGKHKVDGMSDIVMELKRRNWTDDRISRELGMEPDEVLRLCQITGLAELFKDKEFSNAWDAEGQITESDFAELTDVIGEDESEGFRTVNTSDEKRIFHTYEKWECHKAGFYNGFKEGMSKAECEKAYKEFLSDIPRFKKALAGVISEWVNSCEHYLTNAAMNRIAWLGQASACYAMGIPSAFRSGFSLLTKEQQEEANKAALEYLNKWLKKNKMEKVDMNGALSNGRQSDIY